MWKVVFLITKVWKIQKKIRNFWNCRKLLFCSKMLIFFVSVQKWYLTIIRPKIAYCQSKFWILSPRKRPKWRCSLYRKSCLCVEFYHDVTKKNWPMKSQDSRQSSDVIGLSDFLWRHDKIRRIGRIFDITIAVYHIHICIYIYL